MASDEREELPAGEVHLWQVDPDAIDRPELLEAYHGLMTPEEAARQRRFAFPQGRREALVSRALVRTRLSRYTGVDPRDWRFETGPHGRPEIAEPADRRWLRFNLSHTRGRIVCALARDVDVGVDVENVRRQGRFLDVADRYFSPREVAALFALPEAEREAGFFDYWTLKESYIKARGMGLAIPLGRFSFELEPGRPIRIAIEPELRDDPGQWQFERLVQPPEHVIAVAVRRGRGADYALRTRPCVPLAAP